MTCTSRVCWPKGQISHTGQDIYQIPDAPDTGLSKYLVSKLPDAEYSKCRIFQISDFLDTGLAEYRIRRICRRLDLPDTDVAGCSICEVPKFSGYLSIIIGCRVLDFYDAEYVGYAVGRFV